MIDEREFEIINILASNATMTQRELAAKTDLSLGMINVLLKRLMVKGYLRVRQLNPKKVEYLLTAHGILEKAQKSYRYTLKTIDSIQLLRQRIVGIWGKHSHNGYRRVCIVGFGSLADFAALVLKDQTNGRIPIQRTDRIPQPLMKDVLCVDALGQSPKAVRPQERVVNLLHVLSSPREDFL